MSNNVNENSSDATPEQYRNSSIETKPSVKSPWNPGIFYLLTFFGGFGAAGVIAGINYQRLGKPELKWSTIGISLAAFAGYLGSVFYWGIDYEFVFWLANFVPAIILERIQRPHYQRWKEEVIHAGRSGWGIPVLVTIGSWAIILVVAVIIGAVITPWSIADIGHVTPISDGESVQGNLSNNRDIDVYSFDAVQGKIYRIRTTESSPGNPMEDPALTIWYADRVSILAYNDDYGGSLHACIEWKAESTDTLFISVESADLVSYGDYILTLECFSR